MEAGIEKKWLMTESNKCKSLVHYQDVTSPSASSQEDIYSQAQSLPDRLPLKATLDWF